MLVDIDWVVVGALARDYAFRDSDDLKTLRATNDVDLAVLMQSWEEFYTSVERLCASGKFQQTEMPHRLQHTNGQWMDFLPFGGVEKDHHIAWPPDGVPEMNVMGFMDVLTASPQVFLPNDIMVRIAPAPAVAFLKMLAWCDSPSTRERDIEDIAAFIQGYITEIVGWNQVFADYEVAMTRDDFDLEEAGAYVMGNEIAGILSSATYNQTLELVAGIAEPYGPFVNGIKQYLKTTSEHAQRVCEQLLKGLREATEKTTRRR